MICLCGQGTHSHSTAVELGGQPAGLSFVLLPCGLQGQNAAHLAGLQGALTYRAISLGCLVVLDKVQHRLELTK